MKHIIKILNMISQATEVISGAAAILMASHITIAVIVRAVFNDSLLGTNAIVSTFYMVTLTFLGVFTVSMRDEHISVSVLVDLLPRSARAITEILSRLATLIFFVLFTWGLVFTATQMTDLDEKVDAIFAHITVWPLRWAAVAGISLSILAAVLHLTRAFHWKKNPLTGEEPYDADY